MEGDAKYLAKTEKRNSFQRMQSKCENHCIMYKGVTQWINLGKIVAAIHLICIGASVIGFSSKDFFLKNIFLGPREVQISWFLVIWSMNEGCHAMNKPWEDCSCHSFDMYRQRFFKPTLEASDLYHSWRSVINFDALHNFCSLLSLQYQHTQGWWKQLLKLSKTPTL